MTQPLRLLVVLAEPEIAEALVDELRRAGARGVSWTEGRILWERAIGPGAGRPGEWEGSCVRLETVVPPAVETAVFAALEARWFRNYAVFAFAADASVARTGRYEPG